MVRCGRSCQVIASQGGHQSVIPIANAVRRIPVAALAIELTYTCNQACAYCYNPGRSREADPVDGLSILQTATATPALCEPTTDIVLARVERLLAAWEISLVTVTGGEPLRHASLVPLLELLRQRGIPTQMISNGTLIRQAMAQLLARLEIRGVQITLNGPNAEAHRAHVGRDSFGEAIAGARTLLAEGVPVIGCIVVTRQNAGSVGEIVRIWRDLGVRCVALSRFSPAGMSLERMQAWLPRRQDLMTAFTQAQPYASAAMPIHCTVPVPGCLFDTEEFAPIRFGQCAIGSPYQEFALGPDGALRLCTLHAGRLVNGRDVLDPDWDLTAVPGTSEVARYRSRMPDFCRDCARAVTCLGGCSASMLYRDDAEPRALDPLVQQYFANDPVEAPVQLERDARR